MPRRIIRLIAPVAVAASILLFAPSARSDGAVVYYPAAQVHVSRYCIHGKGGTNKQKSWCQLTHRYRHWRWYEHGQFTCLKLLWDRESGWYTFAQNSYSGAYGIPQALPASKMASAGPDWPDDPWTQMRWGYGYIRSVYGTPCIAWNHEINYGWY